MNKIKLLLTLFILFFTTGIFARTVIIKMYKTSKTALGRFIGTVTATNIQYGLLLTPYLKHLSPGLHGFHVHQYPSCANYGKAAGGHFDPKHTGKHLGPYNNRGHLGDLPVLYVNKRGMATLPILAPRLKVRYLYGHSLMIHAGGDNYSDTPKKLGGGGARVACGVVLR